MKEFEYKIATGKLHATDLNKLGKQGWELVMLEPCAKARRFIFKREKVRYHNTGPR